MKSKLEIKITENKSGGKVTSYHLMTKQGQGSFVGGGEIMTADEMRQIAKGLMLKADEIERKLPVETVINQSDIERVKALLRENKRIAAVRLVKNLTGFPLVPCKRYVDYLEK